MTQHARKQSQPAQDFPTWRKPANTSLAEWFEGQRIARFDSRTYDWNALKFQADFDPKYRRAQMRYIGLGAAGARSDANVIPAENFTFSTMVLPAGCEGPMHLHTDVEEVFFMLRGRVKLFLELDGETAETVLDERDVVSIPPGVYRGLLNCGQEEALMCVMLGVAQPALPTYPPDHPLAKLERA